MANMFPGVCVCVCVIWIDVIAQLGPCCFPPPCDGQIGLCIIYLIVWRNVCVCVCEHYNLCVCPRTQHPLCRRLSISTLTNRCVLSRVRNIDAVTPQYVPNTSEWARVTVHKWSDISQRGDSLNVFGHSVRVFQFVWYMNAGHGIGERSGGGGRGRGQVSHSYNHTVPIELCVCVLGPPCSRLWILNRKGPDSGSGCILGSRTGRPHTEMWNSISCAKIVFK